MMCRKRREEKRREEWKNSKRQTNRKRGGERERGGKESSERKRLYAVEDLLVKVEKKEENETKRERVKKRVMMLSLLVDASVTTSTSLILVLIVGLLTRVFVPSVGALVKVDDKAFLVFHGQRLETGFGGKSTTEVFLFLACEGCGKLDLELDDQKTSVVRISFDGHSFVGNHLHGLCLMRQRCVLYFPSLWITRKKT